jgi:ATP-binding cassette subfamily F protein 3
LAAAQPAAGARPDSPASGVSRAEPAAGKGAASPATPEPPVETSRGPKSREEKRREAEARQRLSALVGPLRRRIEDLEKKMAEAEQKVRLVEYELASPATYQNPAKARGATDLQSRLKKSLETLEKEWEEAAAQLQEAERRFHEENGVVSGSR